MPTFGRFNKHSQRSQHSAAEPRSAGAAPPPIANREARARARSRADAEGQGEGETDDHRDARGPPPPPQQQLSPSRAREEAQAPASQAADLDRNLDSLDPSSPVDNTAPRLAFSSNNPAAFSSSESFDTRPPQQAHQARNYQQQQQQQQQPPYLGREHQQQHQQYQQYQQQHQQQSSLGREQQHPLHQLQQPPAPPPHLYGSPSAVSTNTSTSTSNRDQLELTAAPPASSQASGSASTAAPTNTTLNASDPSPVSPVSFNSHRQQVQAISASDLPSSGAVDRSQGQRYSTFEPLNELHLAAPPQQQSSFQHQHQHQDPHHSQAHQTHQSHHQYHTQREDLSQGNHTASSSLDDLPGSAQYPSHVVAQLPEKRSARKLLKGIFGGGSHRSNTTTNTNANPNLNVSPSGNPSSDSLGASTSTAISAVAPSTTADPTAHHNSNRGQGQGPPNSYDNTAGLARRPSKRASNSLNITTNIPHQAQPANNENWQTPIRASHIQQNSPIPGSAHPDGAYQPSSSTSSNKQFGRQGSQLSTDQTIRSVAGDPETPLYEDAVYQEPQLHAPPSHHQFKQGVPLQASLDPVYTQAHSQDEPRYDAVVYEDHPAQDNAQQPFSPLQQTHTLSNAHLGLHQQDHEPRMVSGHLGLHHPQHSSDSVSQISRESPVTDSDSPSTHQGSASLSPAAYYQAGHKSDLGQGSNSFQGQPANFQHQQHGIMSPPPAGGPPNSRRAQDVDKPLPRGGQMEPPPGPPPGFRHTPSAVSGVNPVQAGSNPGAPGYRGERSISQLEGPIVDQERLSPQPSSSAERESGDGEKAFKDLRDKYKNVKRLYFDGKLQIENLTSQVEQLQNAVANQRLTQSRTAWDDNEYMTRFNRLNGAINNLSFNIRKDWRTVPPWLAKYVSADALKTGKQEMTAVGRAVISKWLVEALFNCCFHPGLEPGLSAQLKEIELSIRGNAYTMHSQEEFAALTASIVSWRMTTLEGLQRKLSSPSMAENRDILTTKATTNLTACLYQYLNTPPPAGIEGFTTTIAELAVAITANLPLESRDVAITYPLPGDMVRPDIMDVEKTGLPLLEAQKREDEANSDSESDRETSTSALPKDPNMVRFAGFVALEVRGRQVLMKAPVWTL